MDHYVKPMVMLVNPRQHRRGQRETEFLVKMCLKVKMPARFMEIECKKDKSTFLDPAGRISKSGLFPWHDAEHRT